MGEHTSDEPRFDRGGDQSFDRAAMRPGALLMGASLRGLNLAGVDLTGANLTGADLTGADLRGASLSFAHLTEALLVGADLREADLRGVSWEGAQLQGALLKEASLSSLRFPSLTRCVVSRSWLASTSGWGVRLAHLAPRLWVEREPSERGRSTPLVALHGMMGSALDFEPLALALGRPVWALDLFGHAETPPHPLDLEVGEEPPALSFEEVTAHTAELLEGLLRRLDEPCELLGYSMGGRLALSVVALWVREENTSALSRLKRLTLLGASPGLEGEAERAARREADERWAERLEGFEGEELEEVLDQWSAQPILARLAEVNPQCAAEQRQRRLEQHSGEALACAMRALSVGGMPPLWAELSTLPCLTRWVSGALDAKFTHIARRAAATQGERASVHLIEEAGHSAHLEAPEALAKLFS